MGDMHIAYYKHAICMLPIINIQYACCLYYRDRDYHYACHHGDHCIMQALSLRQGVEGPTAFKREMLN